VDRNKSNDKGVTNRKAEDSHEYQLVLFQPQVPEVEEEKHNRFLLWFGHKKVLLTALISLFFIVASVFVVFSYKWIVACMGDKQTVVKAKQISDAQLILRWKEKTFTIDLRDIGYDGKDIASINKWELHAWFDQLKRQINVPPKNANQKRIGDKIQPERTGFVIDEKQLSNWQKNLKSIINKPQQLKIVKKSPIITTKMLKQVNQKVIGNYTTYFDQKNVVRTNNMRIAAKSINNIILLPGEIFSFNKIVGERTLQKGYRFARTVVKGEYSEGMGEGICQVSSTLFNSVDQAGLLIEKRFSFNSQVTSYVPKGRDATVSWGEPDFRFKNNLDKPVLIRAQLKNGKMTITTYSVPNVKIKPKKVKNAPVQVSQMMVKGNYPAEELQGES
jgi:vancomycin resistance protein YoaR